MQRSRGKEPGKRMGRAHGAQGTLEEFLDTRPGVSQTPIRNVPAIALEDFGLPGISASTLLRALLTGTGPWSAPGSGTENRRPASQKPPPRRAAQTDSAPHR